MARKTTKTTTPSRKRSTNVRRQPWFKKYWRPAMAWQYFVVCLFDFLIAPMTYTALQTKTAADLAQWEPITLQGGGIYHVAMGAIIGVYAWSRGQEKIQMFRNQQVGADAIEAEFVNKEIPLEDSEEDIFVKPSNRKGA